MQCTFEAVDHTLWDIRSTDAPFGGIPTLLCGDSNRFCQMWEMKLNPTLHVDASLISLAIHHYPTCTLPPYQCSPQARQSNMPSVLEYNTVCRRTIHAYIDYWKSMFSTKLGILVFEIETARSLWCIACISILLYYYTEYVGTVYM